MRSTRIEMSTSDFVIVNARIWSHGDAPAEALAARDGRVIAVGANDDITCLVNSSTNVFDAGGRRVIPGLCDAHLHLVPGGLRMNWLDLAAVQDRGAFVRSVQQYAEGGPAGEWVVGGGWSNDRWPDAALPRREWVDGVTADRPMFLFRVDCHAALANSAALRLAGIDRHGPSDPVGGGIDRDAGTREPTGILRETAMELVRRLVPPPGETQRDAALAAAMRHANEHGITMVHNMLDTADIAAVQRAHRDGRLTLRMYNILHERPMAATIELWRSLQPGDDVLRCGAAKNYCDGSLGSRTAWMLEPYEGEEPDAHGMRVDGAGADDDLLAELVQADRAGLQLCAHAIGDAANRLMLDLYEAVARRNGRRDRRPRIEHAQHIDARDVARFGQLGVIASMQPIHKLEDGLYAERALGARGAAGSYRFRDLLDGGATPAFGSDWPIVSINPFEGIHAAVTGRIRGGGVWLPEQNLSVDEALAAYTTGPARACFMETQVGRLAPGFLADAVVLDRDILATGPEEIAKTRVVATIMGGLIEWQCDA